MKKKTLKKKIKTLEALRNQHLKTIHNMTMAMSMLKKELNDFKSEVR